MCKQQGVKVAPRCCREGQTKIWATHKKLHRKVKDSKKKKTSSASTRLSSSSSSSTGADACCDEDRASQVGLNLTEKERAMFDIMRDLLRRLREGSVTGRDTKDKVISGSFEKLLDGASFRENVFPGMSSESMEQQQLPSTITEFLQWHGMSQIPDEALIKVTRQALKVLEGATARGQAQGMQMDAVTERLLMPQIGQESLGRWLLDTAKQKVALSNQIKKHALREAWPDQFPEVEWPLAPTDMLDAESLMALQETGAALQADYMGPEWSPLIQTDLDRFCRDEELVLMPNPETLAYHIQSVDEPGRQSSGTSSLKGKERALPRMAWIDDGSKLGDYPALQEAVRTLQFLPYEINVKAKAEDLVWPPLLEIGQGCVLVLHFRPGDSLDSGQLERLLNLNSGRPGSTILGVNVRVVCSYNVSSGNSGSLAEFRSEPKTKTKTKTKPTAKEGAAVASTRAMPSDTVILCHSPTCSVHLSPATSEYFAVVSFLHANGTKS